MCAIDIDLCKHGEGHAIVHLTKRLNLIIVQWFLIGELIAWKAEHAKTLLVVLVVQCLQTCKLWCEPSLARSVHNQEHLACVGAQRLRLACCSDCVEVKYRHHTHPSCKPCGYRL